MFIINNLQNLKYNVKRVCFSSLILVGIAFILIFPIKNKEEGGGGVCSTDKNLLSVPKVTKILYHRARSPFH